MNVTSEERDLITRAVAVRQRAYAPYSKFQVGAAVRTTSGEIYLGVNVENASYGLSICAERTAITAAVTAGHIDIESIAIATHGAATPCGACRQFMAEWGSNLQIFLVDADSPATIRRFSLPELLPHAFELDR